FLDDLAEVRSRHIVPQERGMNHPSDRTGRAGRFVQRFGEVASLNQIRKSLQKFANVNGSAMEIEKALQKDRDGDNAAGQNRPHEQPALLSVINQWWLSFSPFFVIRTC